jgi:signal transduction histidine kinase
MAPESLTRSYTGSAVRTRSSRTTTASLRRRLPLLIFALLGLIGAVFSAMAFLEVKRALRVSGSERIAAAAGQVAELLGQSANARLADATRLANDPQLQRIALAETPAPNEDPSSPLSRFTARNAQAIVWLYESGRTPRALAVGQQAQAHAGADPPPLPPIGLSPLRTRDGRVWYHSTVAVAASDAAPPTRLVSVQRPLNSAAGGALIERLIGSGVVLKFGNVSGDLWTDLSVPVESPPTATPGSPVTYTTSAGEVRLGSAVPVPGTPWLLWTDIPEASLLAPARTLLQRMIPITIALTAFAALAVYALSGRITSPLEQVAQAADAMAAGDYTRRVDVQRGDEIGRLAAAFNVMAARVEASHEELESHVRARTKELEHAREELHQYTADLAVANRELESFSYSVSHDLRAPLRSIDGFAQALAEDYTDRLDETGRDYLSRIRAAAQRMGALIDDLLSLSRVTRVELTRSAVDLSALVQETAQRLRESDPSRQVEWRIQPNITVAGDPRLLRLALDNLLENAWKFTGKRHEATIEFRVVTLPEGSTAFVVRDNGAGFDMAHAGKLFGAFQRLHGMSEFPGTGIGLATVQRVIRRHGGRIWAEAAPDVGAAFFFTLEAS